MGILRREKKKNKLQEASRWRNQDLEYKRVFKEGIKTSKKMEPRRRESASSRVYVQCKRRKDSCRDKEGYKKVIK